MNSPLDDILTAPQVAAYLGVSYRRINQLIQAGRLQPAGKVGYYNVFLRSTIEAYRANRPKPGRPAQPRDAGAEQPKRPRGRPRKQPQDAQPIEGAQS